MKKQLLLLPLLAITLTGCKGSNKSSSEITLSIWEDESNIEMVQALCDDFLAEYRQNFPNSPKIKIEFTSQAEKSAIEEMARGVAESGNGPDIAAVTHDTIASGVDNKIIAPISYGDAIKHRMTAEALSAVTVDDVVYGYPITAESTTIMYDSTKVSAAELTSFDALLASGKKLSWTLTGDNGGYYTWGLYTDSVLFGASGKDASSVNIGTDKASQNVLDFFKTYGSCFVDESPEDAVSGVSGTVGLVSSPFILSSMQKAYGNKLKLAKLPTINGESMRPFSGYKAYIVSRYSKNASLAQELCNYLTSYDANLYRLKNAGYLPACPLDATEEIKKEIESKEQSQVFSASLADSMVMPNISEMNNFWRPMNNASTYFKENAASLDLATVKTKLNEVTSTLLGS